MRKNKTFFFIPGFKQKATDKQFIRLSRFLKTNGFRVIKVNMCWDYKVMSDYIQSFKDFYNKYKSHNNYILGFSYGAVIALSAANELSPRPKKIYLCSLSPDFKEDLVKMRPWIKKLIGKRRLADIKKRSAIKIAKNLRVASVIFYGEREAKKYPELKIRCEKTAYLARNSKLIVVKNVSHKLNDSEYIKSIQQELKQIS